MNSLFSDKGMFALKRSAACAIGELLRARPRPASHGQRTLMYHSVDGDGNGNIVDGDVLGIYSMTTAVFARQIEALQKICKSKDISIDPFGSTRRDSLSITFDDGYTNSLSVVAPYLSERRIPFHVFVSSARMNGTDRKYLSPAEVLELSKFPGVTIGAHGATHRSLTTLARNDLLDELRASKLDLESVLQRPVTTMSYPHGDADEIVRNAALEAGFSFAATSKWGFNKLSSDPMMQRRLDMWAMDSKRTVENKVLGHWNWFAKIT